MRILGIDYGRVRIGVAISDPSGFLAQPHSVLARVSDAAAIDTISRFAHDQSVARIVVGWPRNMDGSEGARAHQCRRFAEALADASGLPVELYDERLTSVAAERLLIGADVSRGRRKQVLDAIAASMILQGYLDSHRPSQHTDEFGGMDD